MNRVRIAVKRLEEPRIFSSNKLARFRVRPELEQLAQYRWVKVESYNILVVGMQVNTALLGTGPNLRNSLVFVCLVDNLRDDMGPLVR